MPRHLTLSNGRASALGAVPLLSFPQFSAWLHQEINGHARVSAFFAIPKNFETFTLYAVLSRDKESTLAVATTTIEKNYPAFTTTLPSLHLFERELHEQFGIVPEGHPWLKPVRFEHIHGPSIGTTDFFSLDGEDVHEVGVGPIHAGIIECGHFRFQCQGEVVMHLEISLGYHHRGIEKACNTGPHKHSLPLMETLSGDTTIGHSWAYCSNIECLSDVQVAPRGQILRAIALELERLANHTGDLGAIAGDIGYLPTASFCGRLRGDYLNMTAMLCGNRFGRNLLTPGGTLFDIEPELCEELGNKLLITAKDTLGATKLLWSTSSVTARMMGRGILNPKAAEFLGIVGPAARACGIERDIRATHPLPQLRRHDFTLHTYPTGDAYARALVREKEIKESVAFIERLLKRLPKGETTSYPPSSKGIPVSPALAPLSLAVSLVEGWRGEICHVAITDAKGNLCRYKVVDPSFHNWMGLSLAMRSQQISDFPLCNKSFNLSYCGHDQ